MEACLVQLLETGLLHADPHPGNLRYTSSGQIGYLFDCHCVEISFTCYTQISKCAYIAHFTSTGDFYVRFLDFGLLCQMEKKHQFAMLASIVHIVNGDWASLVNSLTEMDVVRPGTNIRRVTMVSYQLLWFQFYVLSFYYFCF